MLPIITIIVALAAYLTPMASMCYYWLHKAGRVAGQSCLREEVITMGTVRGRLNVTMSIEMTVALRILCRKSGLAMNTQAMALLHQSLMQTMASHQGQLEIAAAKANLANADWRAERAAVAELMRGESASA